MLPVMQYKFLQKSGIRIWVENFVLDNYMTKSVKLTINHTHCNATKLFPVLASLEILYLKTCCIILLYFQGFV